MTDMRRAIARGRLESIERYMPGNYDATLMATVNGVEIVLIEGSDQAGWTLDGYVIPRLASGLYPAREIPVLDDPPSPPLLPLPEMTAEWKVIRKVADAIFEVVDNAVDTLLEKYDLDNDERTVTALADQVLSLATTGEQPKS